jgi:hypothetical protein
MKMRKMNEYRGIITLNDNFFECLESYTDSDSRVAMIVIEK